MRAVLKKVLLRYAGHVGRTRSPYRLAKVYRELVITVRRNIKDTILITAGIFQLRLASRGSCWPMGFIDGGATGISLLIAALTNIPLYLLIIGVNIPFIILGYKTVSKQFALKAMLAISGLAICLANRSIPGCNERQFISCRVRRIFLGAGIGLTIRGGAVIDGTEILTIYLSRKLGTTIGDIIILINVIIFHSRLVVGCRDCFVLDGHVLGSIKDVGFYCRRYWWIYGVTIISSHHDEVREMIIHKMGRGLTVYNGTRGYGKRGETTDTQIIYTVITRLEFEQTDYRNRENWPNAFVVMNSVKDTKGGMIKKKPMKD